MTNPLITELNCETGQAVDRPMSDAEYEDFKSLEESKVAERKAAETSKGIAIAKLAALGLDLDDLKSLGF